MSVQPSEHVDGNTMRKGMKLKDEIAEKILGPRGYFTRLFIIIDVHLLVLMIGAQSSLLNFYILKYNTMQPYYYLLFGVDVIALAAIIWSIMVAKKYFVLRDKVENPNYYSNGIDCNPNNNFAKRFFYCQLPRRFGVLPFIYICWLLYTLGLIAKILLVFITDVPNHMLHEGFKLGPQALEMIIALTSIIFLLFIYAHKNSENASHKRLTKKFIDDMVSHTVFEIFDSILFLDLVMPDRDHHNDHAVEHVVRKMNAWLEYTIIILASSNFLIPTINLYHLSKLSACKGKECQRLDLKGKLRHILIHFLRLVSVNYDKALTIFIIKNILCIIMSVRGLFIEIHEYYSLKKVLNEKGSQNGINDKAHSHNTYELHNLSANINDRLTRNGFKSVDGDKEIPNVDNFEDVELK